jgi:HEAT repeat protein
MEGPLKDGAENGGALREASLEGAASTLESLLRDPDERIRRAAGEALKEIKAGRR